MGSATKGLLLAAVLLGAVPSARAGDDKPQAPPSDKTRVAALQAVVQAWCKTRENLVGECPTCGGRGYNGRFGECTVCHGKRIYIGPTQWQRLHYDVYSPAKRLKLRLADVRAARDGEDPAQVRLKSCRFDRVELVGATFGKAWVFEGKDTVSRESRWVEAVDPSSKKTGWYLWSEDADGPWEESPSLGGGRTDVAKSEPLKSDELQLVRGKVALVETKLSLEDAARENGTLVLVFSDPKASDATALELDTAASVVALATAALDALKDVPAVRLVVLARWRDKFGEVRKRPFRTAEISRETYGRIHFERLSREEQLSHFTVLSPTYEGEILWWKD
jgi:hypothetical protein